MAAWRAQRSGKIAASWRGEIMANQWHESGNPGGIWRLGSLSNYQQSSA